MTSTKRSLSLPLPAVICLHSTLGDRLLEPREVVRMAAAEDQSVRAAQGVGRGVQLRHQPAARPAEGPIPLYIGALAACRWARTAVVSISRSSGSASGYNRKSWAGG